MAAEELAVKSDRIGSIPAKLHLCLVRNRIQAVENSGVRRKSETRPSADGVPRCLVWLPCLGCRTAVRLLDVAEGRPALCENCRDERRRPSRAA
jgi:hypothetical protein